MVSQELDLVPGLSKTAYVFDRSHALLALDAWKDVGPNIGRKGENLTISFLSMNRSTLSEKLLYSINEWIPDFSGEVLIIDNGSISGELERLKNIVASLSLKIRIVELGRNYGVAGGRNRTIPHVNTEWVMCLDNDIYFVSNPLKRIQDDLATLGCHFLSLPLLDPDGKTVFARGGHLYVSYENGELHIGAGSACRQLQIVSDSAQPFIGTFLFGGACVFNKETFSRLGGYDEEMFVGFEDIDFSIRLFQQGYKVGATACCALIHDHPKPDSESDRDYEKERFSRNVLHKSALHLEAKHGFKIWSDAVDRWLNSRQEELGLNLEVSVLPPAASTHDLAVRKKIALVIDTDNWAFGNISRQLQNHLKDSFEFTVIPMDIIDNIDQVFMMAKDCNLIHFFWREHLTLIGTEYYRAYIEKIGLDYNDFHSRFIESKRISTSIYDHLLLEENELQSRCHLFSGLVAGYTVGSEKLNQIYSNLPGYPKPAAVVEDGVDLSLFRPLNIERLQSINGRNLVVGWVGNSKWASEIEDFKGVNTILKPAIEMLRNEGWNVSHLFADRQEAFIPHDKMPEYYSKIDVLVCTSKIEGTPNPVLEAMACGVPIISTDVGVVPQVFGSLQHQFILAERSVQALCSAIKHLSLNPSLLMKLSEENLARIEGWDWSVQARKFGEYFDSILSV